MQIFSLAEADHKTDLCLRVCGAGEGGGALKGFQAEPILQQNNKIYILYTVEREKPSYSQLTAHIHTIFLFFLFFEIISYS